MSDTQLMSSPRSVDIALTGRCNLSCKYCFYADEMVARSDLPTELHIPVKESTDSENSRPLRRVNKTGQMIIHYVDDMALSARSFLCDSPCISMR